MGSLEGKKAVVAELVEKFNASKTVVVVDYRGLTVAQATKLRKQLREAGVDYRVVKNTLLTIAAKEAGAEALVPTFKGVLLEGEFLDQAGVIALGELPPKEVLLAQVASCFQAPIQRLAYVLEEVRKSKETA